MCSAWGARLCWRHGGAIKVGEFDGQNKGYANRGDEASQKLWLCASPVADGTTAGADLHSTVVCFAPHVLVQHGFAPHVFVPHVFAPCVLAPCVLAPCVLAPRVLATDRLCDWSARAGIAG